MQNEGCEPVFNSHFSISNFQFSISSLCLRVSAVSLLAFVMFGASAGCSTLDWTKKLPWSDPEKQIKQSAYDRPVRMVAIWTPTTLTHPGKPPTRGLGGRLYFYNDASQTIPVEGQLLVYAYDDSHKPESPRRSTGGVDEPDRKYAFTAEQFTAHYSPTDLGASYSVWIPWGPTSGPPAEVSLVPVFTAAGGNIVMGQPSRQALKGTRTAGDGEQGSGDRGQETGDRGHDVEELPEGVIGVGQRVRETEMRSTTIPLSDTTSDRLSRPQYLREGAVLREGEAPAEPYTAEPFVRQWTGRPQSFNAPSLPPSRFVQPASAQGSTQDSAATHAVYHQNAPASGGRESPGGGAPSNMLAQDRVEPAVYTSAEGSTSGVAPAAPRSWPPTRQRPVDFERQRFPAPALPAPPRSRDPAPTSPYPSAPRFGLPSSP